MHVKSSGVCNRHDMPNFASFGKGDTGVSCMIGILLLSICKTPIVFHLVLQELLDLIHDKITLLIKYIEVA